MSVDCGEFVKMGSRDIYGAWNDADAGVIGANGGDATIKFYRFHWMRFVPAERVSRHFPSWCFREYCGVVHGYHVEALPSGCMLGSVRVP